MYEFVRKQLTGGDYYRSQPPTSPPVTEGMRTLHHFQGFDAEFTQLNLNFNYVLLNASVIHDMK